MGMKSADPGAGSLSIGAGQATALGNTLLLTPASGKSLRLWYVSYNPATAAEIGFRFGAAGTIWLRNNLVANSVIAKDFKDFKFIQGAADEELYLNQTPAVTTNWTVFYLEV